MSQHDLTVDNAAAATVRSDINGGLQALGTKQSGGTAPSTNFAHEDWVDTSPTGYDIWKIRDAANSAHLKFARIPTSGGLSIYGNKGADIASASTTDLSAATGQFVDVTGTTTITGFGTEDAGVEILVRFTGALTLTYNATSMILQGNADIKTVAGDTARFVSLGSGNWLNTQYTRATLTPSASGCINFASLVTTTDVACSTDIPLDDTIPQITEGDVVLNLSYTPKSANGTLEIFATIPFYIGSSGNWATAALFKDSGPNALCSFPMYCSYEGILHVHHVVAASSTTARTYQVRVGPAVGGASVIQVNIHSSGDYGNTIQSVLTVKEYA